MAGYDNPFFFPPTGRESSELLFDPFRNDAELYGSTTIYTVGGQFAGVSGGVQIPIDLSNKVISPTLQARFGGIPIWVWIVAIGVTALFYFKK